MTTTPSPYKAAAAIPPLAGIGLRSPHHRDVVDLKPNVGWLEVHPENYMAAGGAPLHYLETARQDYPLSLHGVGLSLGSAQGLDESHLQRLKALVDRFEPGLVSEHLSWSVTDATYLNDLIPAPYTEETLQVFVRNINRMQEVLGRQVLIENPSTYLSYHASTIPEVEFLKAIVQQTGCGVLLDVNNVFVSAKNLGGDPEAYMDALPAEVVGEIHLAGHTQRRVEGVEIRIDDHGSRVCDDVWTLYRYAMLRIGARPTLIEWDSNIPDITVLVEEAHHAQAILDQLGGGASHVA